MSEVMEQYVEAIMAILPKGVNIYVTKREPSPGVVELHIELSEMENGQRKTGR